MVRDLAIGNYDYLWHDDNSFSPMQYCTKYRKFENKSTLIDTDDSGKNEGILLSKRDPLSFFYQKEIKKRVFNTSPMLIILPNGLKYFVQSSSPLHCLR